MSKRAWVFPGQGSQTVGMGLELYQQYDVVRETFQEADEILGFPLSALCFEGPEQELTRTSNTQPALLTASVAFARLLQSNGVQPDGVAGHSLGEYSALVVADALNFSDALKTVRLRGQLMEEAAPEGTMAAVLGLDRQVVIDLCQNVQGVVEPANFNSPGQVVVAGEVDALKQLEQLAKEAGARRVVVLNVSGPFHSSMLQSAGEQLGHWLERIEIRTPRIPVFSNVTARAYTDVTEIKECLARQVSSPVLWEDSILHMVDQQFSTFIEVGPGRVLSGLIRRIAKDAQLLNIESEQTLNAVLSEEGVKKT